MEKTMKALRRRHAKEVQYFQDNCPHKKSKWMDYAWAPGHLGSPVRCCTLCEKILEHSEPGTPTLMSKLLQGHKFDNDIKPKV